MTRRQYEVYQFIKKYIEDNKISPSYVEILRGCGMKSKSHAFVIINRDYEKGGRKVAKSKH
jgi:SOS-response transcriptional repressor LexA